MSRKRKKTNPKKNKSSKLETFLRTEILHFLEKNPNKTYSVKQLTTSLGLWNQVANSKIRATLDRLAEGGKVAYVDKGRYKYRDGGGKTMTGKIQIVKAGYGFLLVEGEDNDVFISPSNLNKAMDGDTVQVKVLSTRRRRGNKLTGEVVKIINRARTHFVGVVDTVGKTHFLMSDDPRVKMEFYISSKHLNGAKDGDKVVTSLLNWDRRSPEVEVVKVIGPAGEHDTEMHAILYQYGFNPEFPAEVEAEAAKVPTNITAAEVEKRRDMREIPTFTIDPIDAKDFDDALSFQQIREGLYEVGVHIADVSHYVKPGTLIDKEAFNRGTSVYLVDRTVPMLPEALSNEACSLNPREDKLTYSAVFEMNDEGKVLKRWFGKTVIHSDYRFHYAEAEQVIQGESDGPFKAELDILNGIAYKLRHKRFATGSIDFDSAEVKFELDEQDKPVKVVKVERGDSNRLIEDFMLLANREVAAFIGQKFDNPPLPFVYRIHDQPDPEKLSNLQTFVKAFGYEVNFEERGDTSKIMNKLIHAVEGKPEKNVIETIAIRSMAKAIYTTKNIGHYGLGFSYYTHFTSPIRRYPDLLVHRLLTKYLSKEYNENPNVLEEQLKYCSARERTAAEAERTSIKYKQVEFLEDKVGEQFTGVISGVIEAGIFVELDENLCEGMVPTWSIQDDHYDHDPEQYCLRGRRTGTVLRLGDKVVVEIAGTDLRKRNIDMTLVEKVEE